MSGPGAARRGLPLLAAVLALSPAGCQQAAKSAPEKAEPSQVEEVDGVTYVTFTGDAAERVDLRTEPTTASGAQTAVDYAALIYDSKGVPWVYTVPRPLTYARTTVVVDRVEGDRVLLSSGPTPGTPVVTVGAAEVYGTELGIAGSH